MSVEFFACASCLDLGTDANDVPCPYCDFGRKTAERRALIVPPVVDEDDYEAGPQ